jgi:hypothetical protein
MNYSLVLLKTLFPVLGTIDDCVLYFPKKKIFEVDVANLLLLTDTDFAQ